MTAVTVISLLVVLGVVCVWFMEAIEEARCVELRRQRQAHLQFHRDQVLAEQRRLDLELVRRRADMHRALDAYFADQRRRGQL
jgi:hypothetical protein